MAFQKILIPLNGRTDMSLTCDKAFEIAAEFSSYIDALFIRPDPRDAIPLLGEGMSVSMIEDMISISEQEAEKCAKISRDTFNKCVDGMGIQSKSASWIEAKGSEDVTVADFGKLADLIVVSRPMENEEISSSSMVNAVLFETGRPVYVVPPLSSSSNVNAVPAHVAIFWNASSQSAHAVGAAMPFLEKAKRVTVFTSNNDASLSPAQDIEAYLKCHGILSNRLFLDDGISTDAETMLNNAMDCGADLLVMGAFTHSRMRRFILGGMTKYVLENAKIPLFMVH